MCLLLLLRPRVLLKVCFQQTALGKHIHQLASKAAGQANNNCGEMGAKATHKNTMNTQLGGAKPHEKDQCTPRRVNKLVKYYKKRVHSGNKCNTSVAQCTARWPVSRACLANESQRSFRSQGTQVARMSRLLRRLRQSSTQ